jgi:hypothetical protein
MGDEPAVRAVRVDRGREIAVRELVERGGLPTRPGGGVGELDRRKPRDEAGERSAGVNLGQLVV